MRWFHEGVDRLYIGLMHRVVPPLFRHGHTSLPLQEHLAAVELRMPTLAGNQRHTVTARTLIGDVEAGFLVRLGASTRLPVLIYHHGLGEIPTDHTFRWIFPRRTPVGAHLVAIRAPFHRSHVDCARGLATLGRFVAMCAVSVALIEAVRLAFAARGAQGSMVAGISLGGFVTLLHQVTYGTASRYAPLLAGPDLAHACLFTPCHRFLAPKARAQAGHVQAALDFHEAFRASATQRVFPLLARHDLWVPWTYHQSEYARSGVPVAIIDRGHMTGSWAFAPMRAHLLTCLRAIAADEPIGGLPGMRI